MRQEDKKIGVRKRTPLWTIQNLCNILPGIPEAVESSGLLILVFDDHERQNAQYDDGNPDEWNDPETHNRALFRADIRADSCFGPPVVSYRHIGRQSFAKIELCRTRCLVTFHSVKGKLRHLLSYREGVNRCLNLNPHGNGSGRCKRSERGIGAFARWYVGPSRESEMRPVSLKRRPSCLRPSRQLTEALRRASSIRRSPLAISPG